jgi:glycosyltransferase involved in cell wall biosynthesis
MRKIPTIVSCDTTAYHEARDTTVQHPPAKPNIAMERKVFHAATHIVTLSEWARGSVIAEHGIGEDKVTAILPGARLDTFADPLFAPHDRLRILFVGGDFTRKGGWDLLEVFTQRFADRAELHLVTQHPVESTAPNVFIHRGISAYSPQWHEQFRNADVFAMPTYSDCIPLVFQEAAGYGLALLGTSVGAIPEMIFAGENGFLIEPGDRDALAEKLRVFADNRSELLRMRRRSREIALERFDAAKNFRTLADLFRKVSGAPLESGASGSPPCRS